MAVFRRIYPDVGVGKFRYGFYRSNVGLPVDIDCSGNQELWEVFKMVEIGETASLTRKITDSDIHQFAELVGDYNPVHVDDAFARKTRFGRRIAHGMWGVSLISAVLGTRLPGPGTIFLSQTVQFVAPVYPGDKVTAQVTVSDIREDKPIVTLETICHNQDDELVVKGEAVVLLEEIKSQENEE
jgi:3-hydroxybutyryl-CoA dehydratase